MSSTQQPGGRQAPPPARARGGFSLIEVIVSVVLLSAGILGLSSGGTAVARQMRSARGDLGLWAALQTVGDSLQQRGYRNVAGGTKTLGSLSMSWTVDSATANLHRVTLAGRSMGQVGVADTVVLFLVNPSAP